MARGPRPPRRLAARLSTVVLVAAALGQCRGSRGEAAQDPAGGRRAAADSEVAVRVPADTGGTRLAYAGRDAHGVPNYARRAFTPEEASLLRQVFGVGDPRRLYLSDSSATAILKYDLTPDHGRTDEVFSFSLGFASLRRPGESWAHVKQRVLAMHGSEFPSFARVADTSLARLDPAVRPLFERMLRAARARNYRIRVVETYRSPEREAYLMSRGDGHTFTATSMHSYGRAVDVVIGDGDVRHPATRAAYVAFRRWVLGFGSGRLKIIGTPARTWDWSHVAAPAPWLGYHSIEAALAAARQCAAGRSPPGTKDCTFQPPVPAR